MLLIQRTLFRVLDILNTFLLSNCNKYCSKAAPSKIIKKKPWIKITNFFVYFYKFIFKYLSNKNNKNNLPYPYSRQKKRKKRSATTNSISLWEYFFRSMSSWKDDNIFTHKRKFLFLVNWTNSLRSIDKVNERKHHQRTLYKYKIKCICYL